MRFYILIMTIFTVRIQLIKFRLYIGVLRGL